MNLQREIDRENYTAASFALQRYVAQSKDPNLREEARKGFFREFKWLFRKDIDNGLPQLTTIIKTITSRIQNPNEINEAFKVGEESILSDSKRKKEQENLFKKQAGMKQTLAEGRAEEHQRKIEPSPAEDPTSDPAKGAS